MRKSGVCLSEDPHISAARQNNFMYVPCQSSNIVIVLDRKNFQPLGFFYLQGAHGAAMDDDGRTFYTTNFPGSGENGLWTINTRANTIFSEVIDTPFAEPHNIALTPDRGKFFPSRAGGRKLYLTHSGAIANKVTIYKLRGSTPVFHKDVAVGLNPFGLAFVP